MGLEDLNRKQSNKVEGGVSWLRMIFKSPHVPIHWELALQRAGVLDALEESGILPSESEQQSPPQEVASYYDAYRLSRDEALRCIYLGAILGALPMMSQRLDESAKPWYFEKLRARFTTPPLIPFESNLDRIGMLSDLKEIGVLPELVNPNPYDPETEEPQHEQWWQEHQEEAEGFHATFEREQQVIGYLYVGTALGVLSSVRAQYPL